MTQSTNEVGGHAGSPFVEHLGIEMIENTKEQVLLKLTVKDYHLNSNNALHGGVNATILDIILGRSITVLTGARCVTINLNVSYLAVISLHDEIYATGRIINAGYNIVTAEGEIYSSRNEIVSKGVGAFKLLRD